MAVQWSPIGKAVILCLIQIGGIGLIALANMIFISLRRKISLKTGGSSRNPTTWMKWVESWL